MKITYLFLYLLGGLLISCSPSNKQSSPTEAVSFDNKGHELVYQMVQKVGTFESLANRKSVQYTYTYTTPNGQSDITTEKYLFDGELSYGLYKQHQRTFSDLEGPFEQGYDGEKFWLSHDGKNLDDPNLIKRVAFNRPTNYYWFTMMQKLLDPGLKYEYLGSKTIDNKPYEIVKISFNTSGDKPSDIYQLYINKETLLVDQFLFTVVDFNVIETPFLMQLKYEDIDGLLIPTKRQYKKSSWEAEVTEEPWIQVTWTDIKFDTGLTKKDFIQPAAY